MNEKSATHLKARQDVIRHYHPNNGSMMLFPYWKLYLGYLSAALRSPLDLGDRARVLLAILRHMWWAHDHLLDDLRPRGA